MPESTLDRFRRPGAVPSTGPGTAGVTDKGIKLREYKAFTLTEPGERVSHLLLRPGTIHEAAVDEAFSYFALGAFSTDGYGQIISLTFGAPTRAVVEIHGIGLMQLAEAILKGAVAKVITFDPERYVTPAPCEWDSENYEFKGPPLVKQIKITTSASDLASEPSKH